MTFANQVKQTLLHDISILVFFHPNCLQNVLKKIKPVRKNTLPVSFTYRF